MDVDIAVKVDGSTIDELLGLLSERLYVPEEAARRALEGGGSFNVIDTESGYKADLFVLGDNLLDRRQIDRRTRAAVGDPDHPVDVTAPEDQLLRKLESFRAGGEVSDRQWRDVIGLLNVSAQRMDIDDLTRTAELLELDDLLDEALRQSGTS
ncbi:MAG: hypothetical protein JST73_12975 [Actinobacteria bacterium]|nr:hypothetical protein [Actinomycetota bacterium]